MNTLTIRPPENQASRLKAMAEAREISVTKLIAELSTQTLSAFDAETRFKALAATAEPGRR